MLIKIIGLIILGFVIYASAKQIRKDDLDFRKIKDLSLSDLALCVLAVISVFVFIKFLGDVLSELF